MKDLIKEITFLTTTILILGLFSSFSPTRQKKIAKHYAILKHYQKEKIHQVSMYSRCRTLHKERNYHIRHVSKTRKP